jgi:D-alanyl-D-alanine dipeptidase
MKGDTTYVASPYKGFEHNRGCALNMTLIDLRSKEELKMPTEHNSPAKESWPAAPVDDPVIRKNRETLILVMERNGFRVCEAGWSHFGFTEWEKFEVMDIDFEELEKNSS